MWTVSILEDDDDTRGLLCQSIRSSKKFRLLSAYATAEEALRRFSGEKPAVALVDIKLPGGMDGIECVRRLCALVPALPTQFIMLTGHEDDNLIREAFRAGAHGYLLKSQAHGRKLLAAIQEVVDGGRPLTRTVAQKVIATLKSHPESENLLTNQELAVLRLLAAGLMYKEIADELSVSVNTVRTHVESIYHKLHIHSRKDAASYLAHPQQWVRPRDNLRY